jgi:hypothetical protein
MARAEIRDCERMTGEAEVVGRQAGVPKNWKVVTYCIAGS